VKPWGACDPNSAHQLWTEWAWVIQVVGGGAGWTAPVFPAVKAGLTAFFVEMAHGHAAELKIEEERRAKDPTWLRYLVAWRVEDDRGLEPAYRGYVHGALDQLVSRALRQPVVISAPQVKVIAGNSGEGKPPAQLIVLPAPAPPTATMWGGA